MSNFVEVKHKSNLLRAVFLAVAILISGAVFVIGSVTGKNNTPLVNNELVQQNNLTSTALLNSNGWDVSTVSTLMDNISLYTKDSARGNAGGNLVSNVVQLGGYQWEIVYQQNGVVTLYATAPVVYMPYDSSDNSYLDSEVRAYLINEFYPELCQNVSYEGFADLIVGAGDKVITTQLAGMQAVPLSTSNGSVISANDVVEGDKIWIPSALEVGGFAVTSTSPQPRVNSYKTLQLEGLAVNSGLWNLSNSSRASSSATWLRGESNDQSISLSANGLVQTSDINHSFGVRPAINLVLPKVQDGILLNSNPLLNEGSILLAVDYSQSFAGGAGSSASPYIINTADQLIALSDSVMSGQTWENTYFQLGDNINMTEQTLWSPIGRQAFPFNGNFNGNGYTVANLAEAGAGLVGLFGYINNAVVQNVGVVDSTWSSTNNYIAGVVCQANNSLIAQCYNDCGISGGEYVAGVVAYIDESYVVGTTVSSASNMSKGVLNCYNIYGIAGERYVGGVVGVANNSMIANSYNIGSVSSVVTGINYCGAIVANSTNSDVTHTGIFNCYYNSSVNNSKGSFIESFDTLRNQATYINWAFYSSEQPTNPWFISSVINDRFPILHIFMKEVVINVISNQVPCTHTIAPTNSVGKSAGTYVTGENVTITATYQYQTNSHYKFVGWYHYTFDGSGEIAYTDRVFMASNDEAVVHNSTAKTYTYSFNAIDYSYIEARFVRLYNVEITPEFLGFSQSYVNDFTTEVVDANGDATTSSVIDDATWYQEGDVITITAPANSQRQFVQVNYSRDGITFAQDTSRFVKVANSGTNIIFTITVVNENGQFASGDILYVQPKYQRIFAIDVDSNIMAVQFTDETKPQSAITFNNASSISTTLQTASNGDRSALSDIVYNNAISASAGDVEGKLNFSGWEIYSVNGETTSIIATSSTATSYNLSNYTIADSVVNVRLMAVYAVQTKQLSILTKFDNEVNMNTANKVILSLESLELNTIPSTASTTNYSINAPYGTPVYIYIVPAYNNGFDLDIANTSPVFTKSGEVYDNAYIYSVNVTIGTEATTTYNVNFMQVVYSITNLTPTVDGLPAVTPTEFTFSHAVADLDTLYFNTSLNTAPYLLQVTVEDTVSSNYYLDKVLVTISDTDYVIIQNVPEGVYSGTPSAQSIFNSTTNLISQLYASAGVSANATNTEIGIKVNFKSILRSITINQYYDGAGVADNIILRYDLSVNSGPAVAGNYGLNSPISITANGKDVGHKISSMTIQIGEDTPTTVTPGANTWNNSVNNEFILTDNVVITINIVTRVYEVRLATNLNDATMLSDGVSLADRGFDYKIGSNAIDNVPNNGVLSTSVKYGESVQINGYSSAISGTGANEGRSAQLFFVYTYSGAEKQSSEMVGTTFTKVIDYDYASDIITFNFQYRMMLELQVQFVNENSALSNVNGALIILENEDTRIALLLQGATEINVNCPVGEYTVVAILPIFISGDVTFEIGGVIQPSVENTVTLTDEAVNAIRLKNIDILAQDTTMYGTGSF